MNRMMVVSKMELCQGRGLGATQDEACGVQGITGHASCIAPLIHTNCIALLVSRWKWWRLLIARWGLVPADRLSTIPLSGSISRLPLSPPPQVVPAARASLAFSLRMAPFP
jgi:hypothetical protein